MKIPKSKIQNPNKHQTPNTKWGSDSAKPLIFGIWSLFGIWDLGFGIWESVLHFA